MSKNSWYSRYDAEGNKLAQGLILPDFKYINPAKIKDTAIFANTEEAQLPVLNKDVIILTQSCEFEKASLKHVHVCPVLTFDELKLLHRGEFTDDYTENDFFEELKASRRNSKYLLNKVDMTSFPKFHGQFLVVCLDLAVTVSPAFIKSYMAGRGRYYLALNPPYREGMAQAYARYFMRVGNPVNYSAYP